MAITADQVKNLREKTGAPMMDCKKALTECNGDEGKAMEWLREKGIAQAGKRTGRTASMGVVSSYIHMGGKIGVLVEVNCETDFVAKTDEFLNFVKELGMHVAAANPQYLKREEVPLCELGADGAAKPRLGWSTWIKTPDTLCQEDPHATFEEGVA